MLRFKHTKIFSMFFLIEFLSIILILKTIFPNNNYNECLSARNKPLLSILKIIKQKGEIRIIKIFIYTRKNE